MAEWPKTVEQVYGVLACSEWDLTGRPALDPKLSLIPDEIGRELYEVLKPIRDATTSRLIPDRELYDSEFGGEVMARMQAALARYEREVGGSGG